MQTTLSFGAPSGTAPAPPPSSVPSTTVGPSAPLKRKLADGSALPVAPPPSAAPAPLQLPPGLTPAQFLDYLKTVAPEDLPAFFAPPAPVPAVVVAPAVTVAPAAPANTPPVARTEPVVIDIDAIEPENNLPPPPPPQPAGPPPAPKATSTGIVSTQLIRMLTGTLTNPSTAFSAGARDTILNGLTTGVALVNSRTERGHLSISKCRLWSDHAVATGRNLFPEDNLERHLAFIDQCVFPPFRQLNGLFDGDIPWEDLPTTATLEEVDETTAAPEAEVKPKRGRPPKAKATKAPKDDANKDDDEDEDEDKTTKAKKSKAKAKAPKDDDDYEDDDNDNDDKDAKTKAKARPKRQAKASKADAVIELDD